MGAAVDANLAKAAKNKRITCPIVQQVKHTAIAMS
jgi:hypothetical protein